MSLLIVTRHLLIRRFREDVDFTLHPIQVRMLYLQKLERLWCNYNILKMYSHI